MEEVTKSLGANWRTVLLALVVVSLACAPVSWIDDGFTPSWIIYPLILLVGLWRMWRGHGTLYFGIAARVLSADSWLARLGCVARPVPVRGLTQQRRDDEALAKGYLEVGLSAAIPLPDPTEGTRLR
jgi:hypothetical protein